MFDWLESFFWRRFQRNLHRHYDFYKRRWRPAINYAKWRGRL